MTRPRFHLTAPQGWLNDPHGVRWHDGAYHLFHQYVPDGTAWAPDCRWGHAVGRDLLTWEHRGVAIAPGDGDDGVWTGCVVEDDGGAHAFYTAVTVPDVALGRVRVATPAAGHHEDWDAWARHEVVVSAPDDLDLVAFRDPFILREGAGWRMVVGAGTRDGRALLPTWTSPDLRSWTYDGVAASRSTREVEPVWTGALWECPQLFEVDGHWLLVVSVWEDDVLHHTAGAVGTLAGGRFTATSWQRLSHGGSYYAPSFFRDRAGRPCLFLWMRGVADAGQGWSGCLSAPYLLAVRDGRLVAEPHPDVAAARTPAPGPAAGPLDLAAGPVDVAWTPSAGGGSVDLVAAGRPAATLRVAHGAVALERPGHETWTMPWSGGPLRLLVDGPVLEVSSRDGLLGGAIDPADTLVPDLAADPSDPAGWRAWRLG